MVENIGFPQLPEGPGEFKKVREACRNNVHLSFPEIFRKFSGFVPETFRNISERNPVIFSKFSTRNLRAEQYPGHFWAAPGKAYDMSDKNPGHV